MIVREAAATLWTCTAQQPISPLAAAVLASELATLGWQQCTCTVRSRCEIGSWIPLYGSGRGRGQVDDRVSSKGERAYVWNARCQPEVSQW